MKKGKKAIFIIIFSVFAIISSPALSISFQILQDDKSETEIKSSSYYIVSISTIAIIFTIITTYYKYMINITRWRN